MERLNGREPRLLVDPAVDLARVPRSLRHATWIRPFDPSAVAGVAVEAPPEADD